MGKCCITTTTIPDNPFIGRSDTRPEIWAFGAGAKHGVRRARPVVDRRERSMGDELNRSKGARTTASRSSATDASFHELINGNDGEGWLQQPIYFGRRRWRPRRAFYGSCFPEWRGDSHAAMSPLFGRKVIRLVLTETPAGMRRRRGFLLAELGVVPGRHRPDGARVSTDIRPSTPAARQDLRLALKQ
jgi:hypothetical protein